jgi:hypothetical protein
MGLISEDWEIVSRKTNSWWIAIFVWIIFDLLGGSEMGPRSSATWTVRQKSTGITKRVTADSEGEAADKIAKGYFDSDKGS